MSSTITRIRLLLDWEQDAKHAIIWAADKAGLFGKSGLKVEMVPPLPQPLEKVQAGEVELAINYPHNILLLRKDLPNLISVGALVKTNPEGLMTLKESGIATSKDLINKVIAIGSSPLAKSQIKIFLSHHNLTDENIELVLVGHDGDKGLLEGKFDALNVVEYANSRVERKGYETNFFPYINSGVPDSAFLVFTGHEDWVDSNTEALKQFFSCLKGGLDLVKKWGNEEWEAYTDAVEGRNRDEEMTVWAAILPMIDDGGDIFHHNVEELRKLQDILYEGGMLETTYPIEEIFVNSHLV
jgi:ABC-type nitrate/sulfonate/bicarbonate transport system substrate-binding protein